MTGYVRTDTTNNIADGNVISAADLDNEFNGVQAAFNSSTGHTHDGSSAEGAPITKLGPVQDVTVSTTVLGVKTTNTVDLGTSSLKFKDFYLAGNALIGGTLGVTGATTLSAALTYGGVTLSNAVTGTGNMVLSASPTLTGTITAAAANFSGAVALNGNTTIGDADTDTITQAASYVTGTQLKSAKTATNTLALAAYDVDGTAYTNLITLTAANEPTLALTSTGVGTINNMSIGATTASTGAFTTLTSNGATTFTAGTVSTTTGTGTLVITGGLGVSGRINAANFDGIIGANTAAAGSFTTLSATGVTTVQAGTASLPAITTTGDTNTGIWFPAADTIAFTEGGVESMRIDSSGNLGVGVTPSGSSLPTIQSGYGITIGNNEAHTTKNAYYNGGWKYALTASTTAARFSVGESTSAFAWHQAVAGTIGNAITFIQAMTLNASGQRMLGITTPYGIDTVSTTVDNGVAVATNISAFSDAISVIHNQDNPGTGNKNGLFFAHAGSPGILSGIASTKLSGSWQTTLDFYVNNITGVSTGDIQLAARIDSSGNLGIGTTSPKAPLHVVASAGAANDKTLIIQDKTAGNAGEAWLSFKAQESLDDERIKGAIVYANSGSAYGVGNLLFCMNSTADNSNATTANEKMRLDSSGNLGIGTTSPASFFSSADNLVVGTTSGNNGINIISGSTGTAMLAFGYTTGTNAGDGSNRAKVWYDATSDTLRMSSGGSLMNASQFVLDASGNLLVGTTSVVASGKVSVSATNNLLALKIGGTEGVMVDFRDSADDSCGFIYSVASSNTTAYNTSSDYRLKENAQPMSGALAKVSSLKPVTFTWKKSGVASQGFIAHELAEVVPECVTGEKDAVDADGKPQYQGIDTSFLVATLTAAIQEQQALITTLTARITALEGA